MRAGATDPTCSRTTPRGWASSIERAIKDTGHARQKRQLEKELSRTREREDMLLRSLPMALYTADLEDRSASTSWVSSQTQLDHGLRAGSGS